MLLAEARKGAQAALAAGAFLGVATASHARWAAPYRPVLARVTVPLPTEIMVPPIRVGFVTDTHVGPVVRPADVDRAMQLLMSADPDILILGGDYVCDSPRFIADAAAVLGNYAGAAPCGALAVLGNHDYANGAKCLERQFARRGVRVLRNESVSLRCGAAELWFAGIDDALLGNPAPECAFASVPEGASSISLWHEPDWAHEAERRGAFLQLSGHSHGGQIRLPVIGVIAAPAGGRRFSSGLNRLGAMHVYTSRGIGVFRPPVRMFCPPEVTLITLK